MCEFGQNIEMGFKKGGYKQLRKITCVQKYLTVKIYCCCQHNPLIVVLLF